MSLRIILVRHGPSGAVHKGGWLNASGMQQWRDEYDAAGIHATAAAPENLKSLVGSTGIVVSSDMPRALQSAERLAPDEPIPVSPLLRESPLPIPQRVPMRMPLAGWDALMRAQWTLHIANGTDASPKDLTRAHAAVDWLLHIVRDRSPVVAVTHAIFRRLVADRLLTIGWRSDPGKRSDDHWSAWSFERDS